MSVSFTRKPIDGDVLAVLREASAGDDLVVLNSGPLRRDLYERVTKVLNDLGGHWKRSRQGFVFSDGVDPADALALVTGLGLAPASNPLQFFATPPAVADKLVLALGIPRSDAMPIRVLEPSAGDGALVGALGRLRGRGHHVQCFELDPVRARRLSDAGVPCDCRDFLATDPADWPPFDRAVMNPPFTSAASATAYVDHVLHARRFLAPRGRLAAVCPEGFTFAARHRRLVNFRQLVERCGRIDPLPPDAFKAAGLSVRTVLVTLDSEG